MAPAHLQVHTRKRADLRVVEEGPAAPVRQETVCRELQGKLFSRRKENREIFLQYSRALRQIGIGAELDEDVHVAAFINGLDTSASSTLSIIRPKTLGDAVDEIAQHRRSTDVYVPRGQHNSTAVKGHTRPPRDRESTGGKDKRTATVLTTSRVQSKPYQKRRYETRDGPEDEDPVREHRRKNRLCSGAEHQTIELLTARRE